MRVSFQYFLQYFSPEEEKPVQQWSALSKSTKYGWKSKDTAAQAGMQKN